MVIHFECFAISAFSEYALARIRVDKRCLINMYIRQKYITQISRAQLSPFHNPGDILVKTPFINPNRNVPTIILPKTSTVNSHTSLPAEMAYPEFFFK